MLHAIHFADETDDHLTCLTARQRATIFDVVERQLRHQPTLETRNRKRMHTHKPGFIAPWELRIGSLRVYYDVEDGPPATVVVTAVGVKIRTRVRIGDQEYEA